MESIDCSNCDRSRESFASDGEGNLILHTKPSGKQITYTYDGFGNLTGKRGSREQNVYTYDEAGRLSSAGNGGITYHYSYDNCGRLASKKACGRSLIRYGYDLNGNVSVIQDVTGKETFYVYDYENRLKSIEENGRVLAEYRYTPGGKVSSVICGDVATSYEYDGAGNNTVITTAAGDARISRIRYGYDKRGNCIRREYEDFRGASGRIEYAYDGADRLILEKRSGGPVCSYAYDRAGNRVRMEQETGTDRLVTRYVYNDRNRLAELTRSGPQQAKVTFAYDPDGNLTGDGRGIYGYDEFDRMVSAVMENGDSLVCRYDAEGLRYETEENARLFSYIYHGRQVATETGEGSTTRYIRGNGRLTASDSEKARTYYHYVSDQQGSVRYVADSGIGKTDEAVGTDFDTLDERILNRYEYDAFGNLLECEERVYNPFCYTGEQYDRTTQLYYLKARYYNPVIGRFMQQDTYLGDGLNLYAYVQNNPVRYVDPSGHCKDNGVESSGEGGGTGERLIPGTQGVVTGGNSKKLGKNMMESMGLPRGTDWTGYQAQHIIPAEMANHPVLQKIGMDLDDASNGLFLRIPADDISTMSRHRGYHSTYSEIVKTQLDAMDINQSVEVLQKQVYDLQQNLKYLQQSGLPLYPSKGATVDLWQRSLERIK